MGKYFSDAVEQSLRDIYYEMGSGRGQEGFRRLEQASAAGDGDASCILARCLCGYQYTWEGHGFPEDDKRAVALMRRSVEQGSAVGVLLALRSGELKPHVQAKMPFASLSEAFDVVLEKAKQGEPFCQYTVGNAYFWWDFLRIQEKSRNSFASEELFRAYLRENIAKCEDWFWKAYRGGMYHAGNNLNQYYQKGDEDLILPHPEKAKEIWRTGAEKGYPPHQYLWARKLSEQERHEEAFRLYEKAAKSGETDSWFYVGLAYEEGRGVSKDCTHAARCYEKGVEKNVGCQNRLGALYFEGNGVIKDCEKGVRLLLKASESGSKWGSVYLAKAYLNGFGVPKDYAKARQYLEKITWADQQANYLWGLIYTQGLGVEANLKRGVEYLQRAPGNAQAREELEKYKKNLFGKWVRKK